MTVLFAGKGEIFVSDQAGLGIGRNGRTARKQGDVAVGSSSSQQ